MKREDPGFALRLTVLILAPAICGAGFLWLYWKGSPFQCLFHEYTGRYCFGCGSGRAVYAALHGQIRESFGFNPLVWILGIPSGIVLVWEYLAFTLPEIVKRRVHVPDYLGWAAFWLLIVFGILRNLPCFSFLAP